MFSGGFGNDATYGFNYDGEFSETIGVQRPSIEDYVLATDDEVEQALIEEAKRRGFENNKIYCIAGNIDSVSDKLINGVFYYKDNELKYQMIGNAYTVFRNGKWAEIISEPLTLTIDEIAERFGVSVEQIKIKK